MGTVVALAKAGAAHPPPLQHSSLGLAAGRVATEDSQAMTALGAAPPSAAPTLIPMGTGEERPGSTRPKSALGDTEASARFCVLVADAEDGEIPRLWVAHDPLHPVCTSRRWPCGLALGKGDTAECRVDVPQG